jgi:hypothetical protein
VVAIMVRRALGVAIVVVTMTTACGGAADAGPSSTPSQTPSTTATTRPTDAATSSTGAASTVPTPTTAPGPTPLREAAFTAADDGRRVAFDRATYAELRLESDAGWSTPASSSSSVEVVPINTLVDSGDVRWQLAPRRAGGADVTAVTGDGRSFVLHVHVVS